MKNFILENREELSVNDYIRKADPQNSYWFDFSFSKINSFKESFGDNFNLIIAGDENSESDYFVLPFSKVKHIFVEEFLSKDSPQDGKERPKRWVGTIKLNKLKVSKSPESIDISDYYGNLALCNQNLIGKKVEEVVRTGAGFGNPETNKKVEKSAIDAVTKDYQSKGWKVESVEANKCGYDLLCTKGIEENHVEVKGIQGGLPNFIITSGEVSRAQTDDNFVICAVTSALSKILKLNFFTGKEFIDGFDLSPLAFRAALRTPKSD